MATNWKEFAEELLRDLEDARREIADADITWLAWDAAGKVAKRTTPEDVSAEAYLEPFDVEQPIDDLLEDWRRRLYVALIEDDRGTVAA